MPADKLWWLKSGSGKDNGQGWIRTSEGVEPADLQSAPFGHFGTYPKLIASLATGRWD